MKRFLLTSRDVEVREHLISEMNILAMLSSMQVVGYLVLLFMGKFYVSFTFSTCVKIFVYTLVWNLSSAERSRPI